MLIPLNISSIFLTDSEKSKDTLKYGEYNKLSVNIEMLALFLLEDPYNSPGKIIELFNSLNNIRPYAEHVSIEASFSSNVEAIRLLSASRVDSPLRKIPLQGKIIKNCSIKEILDMGDLPELLYEVRVNNRVLEELPFREAVKCLDDYGVRSIWTVDAETEEEFNHKVSQVTGLDSALYEVVATHHNLRTEFKTRYMAVQKFVSKM